MSKAVATPVICEVCKKPTSPHSGMITELIRPSLLEFIKKKLPDLDSKAFICFEDLGKFRKDYIKEVLEDEIGELSVLDQEVIESLEQLEIRHLHEKIDHLLRRQYNRLFEIQQIQVELLEELGRKKP